VNRNLMISSLAALIALAGLGPGQASAQPPDILHSYRFIPSRSTLEVTGGFAGVRQQFFAYGKFGLVTGYDAEPGGEFPPTLTPHAKFVDVHSWLVPDSPLTFVWHTDGTLNLSGLEGTFAVSDSTRSTFQGVDGQGAPFRLTAVQRGRLLHLVGENEPPCCDFFKYRFNALAYEMPYADFNLDGTVDSRDADVLAANIGTFAYATFEQGDADGDGDVDGSDFLAWQREIGAATPMSAFTSGSSSTSALAAAVVPEPTALLPAALGWIITWLAGRRRTAIRTCPLMMGPATLPLVRRSVLCATTNRTASRTRPQLAGTAAARKWISSKTRYPRSEKRISTNNASLTARPKRRG
jgi:hypothetical protein